MHDDLLSVFDPLDIETPEEQPGQDKAISILESKLDHILERGGDEALLEAADFIGYQVDRIRRAQANAGICKQTIAQAQANKKGWERETEFRRWAIQESLEYLKAKGLLEKRALAGADYKVSVSERQGSLEISEELEAHLDQLKEIMNILVKDTLIESLQQNKFNPLGLTDDIIKYLNIDVKISVSKNDVKRSLPVMNEKDGKHFSIPKNTSLTAKI
jgi:hypothetical protein